MYVLHFKENSFTWGVNELYVIMSLTENLDVCPANMTTINGEKQWNVDPLSVISYSLLINFTLTFVIKLYKRIIMEDNREEIGENSNAEALHADGNEPAIYRLHRSQSCDSILISAENTDVKPVTQEDLRKIAVYENREDNVQEEVQDYAAGGYMPVTHEDVLKDRYCVIRKLGFGHFSTVWLCDNKVEKKHVAVKIVKCGDVFNSAALDEIKILTCTMTTDPTHYGYKRILQMYDNFIEDSAIGLHQCVVFELMGPSLLHLLTQSNFQGIQLPGVRTIIKQLLEGLVYLHEVCHIIHTDLKPENILIKIREPYIKRMVDTVNKFKEFKMGFPKSYMTSQEWEFRALCVGDEFEDFSGPSDIEPVNIQRYGSYPSDRAMEDLIGHPDRHSRIQNFQGPIWVDPNIEIKIADLGNACWGACHYTTDIQTKQYRALEVIIGADYSFSADMWSVGCLTFELATGEYLFCPRRFRDLGSQEDHLGLIWELLDGIPSYIAKSGTKSQRFFDKDGRLRHIEPKKLRIWKLEDVLVDKYNWKRVDAIPFAAYIQAMIEPDPELRITAAAALESPWLKDDSD